MLRGPAESLQNGEASAEKFEHTGPAKKEKVASLPQRDQLASTPEPPLPKGKETVLSVQITTSWGGRESQGKREPYLGEKEGNQSGSMGRKGWTSQKRKAGFKEERQGKQREFL